MKIFSTLGLLCLLVSAAPVQPASAQSNSTVRFRVTYGTNRLADIDVELFDSAKPITVSNFLRYAESGAYSNTILHYCAPTLAVQGGYGTVAHPASASGFTALNLIPTGVAIPNEFLAGPHYANVFGTLVMALQEDPASRGSALPNSATASWFFNLGDNASTLDAQHYTVFGSITSAVGTNALQYFNTLGAINRIIATTNAACTQLKLLPSGANLPLLQLPVSPFMTNSVCPRYSDLYNVEVLILNARDVLGPSLTVSNPAANLVITNGTVVVNGAAYDNVAVSNVFVEVNGGAGLLVSSTNGPWSTTLMNLAGGTNIIVVKAYDISSNATVVTRRIFHRVKVPIAIAVVGSGAISGATNGALLEVGRAYTLTAKPAKGHLFGNWSGSTNSLSPALSFLMETNYSLTATFGTNLFAAVQGSYNGLFYDTNEIQEASAGFLTLKVGSAGASSGKLFSNGKSYSVKGTLNAFGLGSFVVVRKGTNPVSLDLSLDLINGTDQVTGTVMEQGSTGTVWTAQLSADRAFYDGKLNIAPQAGKYTVIFPADTNSPAGPFGNGFGAVTVTTKGAVSLAGTLSDGTKVTQRTALSKNSQWPLYAQLYRGKGSLISWVTFTNETDTDFNGLFNWFKQAQAAKYYPVGFTNEALLAGSHFVLPTATNLIIAITNGVVGFTNGNLAANFTNLVMIDARGKVLNQGTNKLSFTFSKSSGMFSGSATPPGGGKPVSFKGALLQKQNVGSGFFLGTNASGRVSLQGQ